MSDQDDFTGRSEPREFRSDQDDGDELQRFLESLRKGLERFPEVQVMVPEDDEVDSTFNESTGGAASTAGGMRCFRLFPSGRRICIPR